MEARIFPGKKRHSMQRDQLLLQLKDYQPSSAEEQLTVEKTIRFIESNSDCFQRSNQAGHLTASAWIINQEQTSALLTRHRKLNIWIQCGGHADGVTDLLTVAQKEASEETGLNSLEPLSTIIFDVDIHIIPTYQNINEHLHYDVRFLLSADITEPIIRSAESHDLAWVDLEKIETLNSSHSIARMVHKTKLL